MQDQTNTDHEKNQERTRPLSINAVTLHFDRGFASRPRVFYERLECRDWLNSLDWLFAEASDRYSAALDAENSTEIERERNILEMLEDEIREADATYCQLALTRKSQ